MAYRHRRRCRYRRNHHAIHRSSDYAANDDAALILYLLSIVLAKVGQRQFDARMVADADE